MEISEARLTLIKDVLEECRKKRSKLQKTLKDVPMVNSLDLAFFGAKDGKEDKQQMNAAARLQEVKLDIAANAFMSTFDFHLKKCIPLLQEGAVNQLTRPASSMLQQSLLLQELCDATTCAAEITNRPLVSLGSNQLGWRLWDRYRSANLFATLPSDAAFFQYVLTLLTPTPINKCPETAATTAVATTAIATHPPKQENNVNRRLVEVGTGRGLYARIFENLGLKVIAFDVELTKNPYFKKIQKCTKDLKEVVTTAHDVLMLAWPPYSSPSDKITMASDALKLFRGHDLIYMGESEGGCTGDALFFEILEQDWTPVKSFAQPNLVSGLKSFITHYRRKKQ
jgi:hypothetical protein